MHGIRKNIFKYFSRCQVNVSVRVSATRCVDQHA
jgi:hypothetical protein